MNSLQDIDLEKLVELIADRVFERLAPYLLGAASSEDEPLLDKVQAAHKINVEPSTMDTWRSRGGGPEFIRVGKGKRQAIRYEPAAIRRYIRERRYANTAYRLDAEDEDSQHLNRVPDSHRSNSGAPTAGKRTSLQSPSRPAVEAGPDAMIEPCASGEPASEQAPPIPPRPSGPTKA